MKMSTSGITETVGPRTAAFQAGLRAIINCVPINPWAMRLPRSGITVRRATEPSPWGGIGKNVNDPFCPRARFSAEGGMRTWGEKGALKTQSRDLSQSACGARDVVPKKTEREGGAGRSLFPKSLPARSQQHKQTTRAASRNASLENRPRGLNKGVHFITDQIGIVEMVLSGPQATRQHLMCRASLARGNGHGFVSSKSVAFDSGATRSSRLRPQAKRAGGRAPSHQLAASCGRRPSTYLAITPNLRSTLTPVATD